MGFARSSCGALVVLLALAGTTLGANAAEERYQAQIDALRKSMEK